ncbi:hypothetical protein [Vibrio anguillarum]|nr:hypothetical protein [Vibrio anguillarum]
MNNYFDGSSFSMIESADERARLADKFLTNANSSSIVEFYSVFPSWWDKTQQVFNSCFSVARDNGQASLVMLGRDGSDFKQYHSLFLSNPTSLKSFGIWAMYQTIQNAELKFIEQCKTPRNEQALTAKLTVNIDNSASQIQAEYEKHLCLNNTLINLSELELQVQNREKATGADIAFILEWRDENDDLKICPILFQAKRVTGFFFDISQKNSKVGYQFNILKAKKTNSAYLFYNCDTQTTTKKPRLPTVKNIQEISVFDTPEKTSAIENVLSLSTFMLDIMVNPSKFKVFSNRTSALSQLLNSVQEDELASVFSLSTDEDARAKYAQSYSQYLAYKKKNENKSTKNNDSPSSPKI